MRVILLCSFVLMFAKAHTGDDDASYDQSWNISKKSYLFSFSAEFEYKTGEGFEGKVIRTGLFTPRYYYDFYDAEEVLQARGITRFFSWGFFFPWGMEIDVYENDVAIGKIEGQLFTKARAKFIFYDANAVPVALAYLDKESADFVIVSSQDESSVLANMQGKSYGDVSMWQIKMIDAYSHIDPKVFKIFAAFVADYHDSFMPPPKVVSYYFYHQTRTEY